MSGVKLSVSNSVIQFGYVLVVFGCFLSVFYEQIICVNFDLDLPIQLFVKMVI